MGADPALTGNGELTSSTSVANNSDGQIGVSGSNAGTIINSAYSTGQNSESACPSRNRTSHTLSQPTLCTSSGDRRAQLTQKRLATASDHLRRQDQGGQTGNRFGRFGQDGCRELVATSKYRRGASSSVFLPSLGTYLAPQTSTTKKKGTALLTSVNRPAARRDHHRRVPRRSLPVRRRLHALGSPEPTFESPTRGEPSRHSRRLDRWQRISYA